mgnify:CR=1 FL=1
MLNNILQKARAGGFLYNWGIGILVIFVGIVTGLLGQWVLGGLLIGIGIGWGVNTWLVHRSVTRPLDQLISQGETSLVPDSLTFTDALVALGQGDLTTQVKLESQPVATSASTELNRLRDLFNTIIASWQGSAKEFNAVTDEPCQRLFYVGADPYMEGRTCGEIMGEALHGRGKVAIIVGFSTQASQELRRKGFASLLREKYPSIHIMETLEAFSRGDLAYKLTQELLKEVHIPDGIYVIDGGPPANVAQAVVDAGLSEKVKIVSHDLVDETMEYVTKGVITATLGQDPFAQGYDTVIHLFNHLITGWRPAIPRLLTVRDVVTQANYRQFWKAGHGIIESQATQDRRAKPFKPSPRPIRIAVVGREECDFWEPVKAGVLAADQLLHQYNARVDWIVPEADKAPNIDIRGPLLEQLVEQGYQAIALDIPQQGLIPYVNKVISRGIPVATFNGEPSSLRGLMSTLDNRAKMLLSVSQDMADSAQKLGGAGQVDELAKDSIVQAISMAIREVARDAQEQAQAAGMVTTAIEQITHAIDEVIYRINDVSGAANLSVQTARDGAASVNETLQQMQKINQAVGITAKTIQEMNTYSEQIGKILYTLEDFANQSNLLALNASIVAAGDSEAGQGFSVVAKEMRELAEKSGLATKEVGGIVKTVQKSIGTATESMLTTIDLVRESSELASSSGQAINQLLASAVAMQQQTVPLVATNAVVRNAIVQLNEANARVSQVISENLAATKQISSTTNDLVSQTEAVSGSAASLAEIARELEGATAMFKIEKSH